MPAYAAGGNQRPQRGAMDDIRDWVLGIPPVTRFLVFAPLGLSLLATFGFVSPSQLYLDYTPVFKKFELWRLVTNFFFGKLDLGFLFHLFFTYRSSLSLETGAFIGRQADYAFMIVFLMAVLDLVSPYIYGFFMASGLSLGLTLVWAQENAEQEVSFFFGIRMKAKFLPYAMVALNFLQSQNIGGVYQEVAGIAAGFGYLALTRDYAARYGGQPLLKTPQFVKTFFGETARVPVNSGSGISATAPRAVPGAAPAETTARRRTWGAGQRLGNE
ncbi:Der1-like family-domain-containing protein [Phlyctochytrium arcticum]|nr:Der1-like family-domain-containing protein [Phlyctochytrium arcticum]